jgi:hypothetical protein
MVSKKPRDLLDEEDLLIVTEMRNLQVLNNL